jgi:hypothetical protein
LAFSAREKLQFWTGRARFNDVVKLVRLAGVFALAGCQKIYLAAAGATVRASLPRTPHNITSVTLWK